MQKLRNIQRKITRRFLRMRGEWICKRQIDPLSGLDTTIVTIIHDFEGDYAIPGKSKYGLRAVKEILRIEDKHGVRGTYNTVARLAMDVPDLIMEIQQYGHEIASHSYDHKVMVHMTPAEQEIDVQKTKRVFSEIGVDIAGHRSPQSAWNFGLMQNLLREHFTWSAENGSEPYPYIVAKNDNNALWRLPVRGDDWAYEAHDFQPNEVISRWKSIIENGVSRQQFTAIGVHPWVQYPPERLSAYDEFLNWLTSRSDITIMRCCDVIDLIRTRRTIDAD